MQSCKFLWLLFVASLFLLLSLGCQFFSTLSGLKTTAESVATEVKTGREFLGTGEAFVTEVAGSDAVATAKAFVTDVADSNVVITAKAFVTQEVPVLKETARAIVTDALATPSEVPEDIPIMEGEKSAFVGSAKAISYILERDFLTVLNYYQEEMLAKGWAKVEYGTVTTDTQAELHFKKKGRTAIVVIAQVPFTAKTMVVITIEQ